jgi:uracil-DNA glycosylase family 4
MANSRTRCTHCGKLLIDPMGNPKSSILLVGDYPGYHETIQGLPFAFRQYLPPHKQKNQTLSGDILRDELTRVGIMLNQVLVTNLWKHEQATKIEIIQPKTPRGKPKEKKVPACPPEWHLNQLVEMFADRTHVLLMGSHVTEALLGVKYNVVSGTKVQIPGVSKKLRVWAAPNPSSVFGQPIGEMRLAFKRFAEDLKN